MTTKTADPEALGLALLRRLEHTIWAMKTYWQGGNVACHRLMVKSIWIAYLDLHDIGLRKEALAILCAK